MKQIHWIVLLVWGLLSVGIPSQAQGDTYQIDLLGISRAESSYFQVIYQFKGIDVDGEPVTIDLTSSVWLQPDPPAYRLEVEAMGTLSLFDLVPPASTQTSIRTELVYLRRGLYSLVEFSDTFSCGKSIASGTPAINRLSLHSPFPSNTFWHIPPANRLLPDGEFAGQPTARYHLDGFDTAYIDDGAVEIHVLPEENQVVYFAFDGVGEFLANNRSIVGTLHYRYQLLPFPSGYEFEKPSRCTPPRVAELVFFEPTVEWIIREHQAFYLTNQPIDTLIAFHQVQLLELGYETSGPFYDLGRASLSFKTHDGVWVDVYFYDVMDGTQVDIRLN